MNKGYLLVICLLAASLTGCMETEDSDLEPVKNVDEIKDETNNTVDDKNDTFKFSGARNITLLSGKYEGQGDQMVIDSKGNTYLVGSYRGTINFSGTEIKNFRNVLGNNETSQFLAKINSSGVWDWVIDIGSTYNGVGINQISLDFEDNLYVGGNFRRDNFTFSSVTLNTTGGSDIFVVKLDEKGVVQWAVTAGGGQDLGGDSYYNYEDINGLTVHSNGDVYVTGSFQKTAWFGDYNITSGGYEEDINAFVAKLSNEGIWEWVTKVAGHYNNISNIELLSTGDAYVSGYFEAWVSGTIFFDDIELEKTACNWCDFVAKISSNGTWIWAMDSGIKATTGQDPRIIPSAIAVDSNDILHVVIIAMIGYDGDPYTNVSIAKINENKEWTWINHFGANCYLSISGLHIDSAGEIYVHGSAEPNEYYDDEVARVIIGNFTIMPETECGYACYDSYGGYYSKSTSFIAKLDASGSWADGIEAVSYSIRDIMIISNDNIYATGYIMEPTEFGCEVVTGNPGKRDIFITEISMENCNPDDKDDD